MTKLWAKMMDIDGDGNLEVVQTHDEDPAGLWHPDLLAAWREVPAGTTIGSVLETATGEWWSGSAWLDKEIAEADPPVPEDAELPAPPKFAGQVLKLRIKEAGSNYEIPVVRNQYDIEAGTHLVVSVSYDATGKATDVELIDGGQGYTVGQTFNIAEGFGRTWSNASPTYTVIEITEVHA